MRRLWLWIGLTMLGGAALAAPWDVTATGAVGDGQTDCTAAFQQALDAAGAAGGGVVTVPAGRFAIKGNLVIPAAVTLQGCYRAAPTANFGRNPLTTGTQLLAFAGRGEPEGPPFIRLGGDMATLMGVAIEYPEWRRDDLPPIPYPPCIRVDGVINTAIIDCLLINPYEGIHLFRAHRHLVRNVNGSPIWRGLFVDQIYDIGRVENVHFWPQFNVLYQAEDPYCKWINLNGIAFEFARTDWQYVLNTFCFGYGVGYKFSAYAEGATNGNFLGIGADSCHRAVLVEAAQPYGILITNGEFVGRWSGADSVGIEVMDKVEGKVSLVNCSFWGPLDRCIVSRGAKAQVTASACAFVMWDVGQKGSPAVQIDAGAAIVQASTFAEGTSPKGVARSHVQVGEGVRSVIVTGNQAPGGLKVENTAGARTQLVANELPPGE